MARVSLLAAAESTMSLAACWVSSFIAPNGGRRNTGRLPYCRAMASEAPQICRRCASSGRVLSAGWSTVWFSMRDPALRSAQKYCPWPLTYVVVRKVMMGTRRSRTIRTNSGSYS